MFNVEFHLPGNLPSSSKSVATSVAALVAASVAASVAALVTASVATVADSKELATTLQYILATVSLDGLVIKLRLDNCI